MGKCNIDHSQESVVAKLESQAEFLPGSLTGGLEQFLKSERPQETLNEVFHLLKKYDLASEEERKERDSKLKQYIK
ncbi:group-specific protein [Bacillus norwichensis]|uniref:Group-specific protein n=1 Tax=Bacillus norwichensis TaxID=2762217 RepID=A0ABR8VH61_9BACI|nr:group-specific protein [Bacillus norwichensis]MBD8004107.1 group-specific protein [Bacillus norwichensis]